LNHILNSLVLFVEISQEKVRIFSLMSQRLEQT